MPQNILIVDDNTNVLEILHQSLSLRTDWNIALARNTREAVREIQRRKFDCIIIDIELGDELGTTLIGQLRSSVHGSESRYVAISAHEDSHTKENCLESGFDVFMQKPLEIRDLIAWVENEVSDFKNQENCQIPFVRAFIDSPQSGLLILANFESTLPGMLTYLSEAIMEKNAQHFAMALHRLKSSLGYLGFQETEGVFLKLKSAVWQGILPSDDLIQELTSEVNSRMSQSKSLLLAKANTDAVHELHV